MCGYHHFIYLILQLELANTQKLGQVLINTEDPLGYPTNQQTEKVHRKVPFAVTSYNFLKAMRKRHVRLSFEQNTIGLDHGEMLGLIVLFSNIFCTWSSTTVLRELGNLRSSRLTGVTSLVSILCSSSVVTPSSLELLARTSSGLFNRFSIIVRSYPDRSFN